MRRARGAASRGAPPVPLPGASGWPGDPRPPWTGAHPRAGQANWATEDFAELRTAHGTLAIGSTRTVPLFAPGSARPADNRTVIIEFLVDDVDGVYKELAGFVEDFVNEPTTMPWGNRALLFRDPDGNLVNFFTPVTPAAIEKFGR